MFDAHVLYRVTGPGEVLVIKRHTSGRQVAPRRHEVDNRTRTRAQVSEKVNGPECIVVK